MGLLNKFRSPGKRKTLQDEVVTHLIGLFNTKQTFGAWQKGLGVRSYSSGRSRADIIEQVIQDIKYNLEKFEERIKIIEIRVMDSENVFNLRFQIKCQLGSSFHSYYVGFKQSKDLVEVNREEST